MTTAREIMTPDAVCAGEDETLLEVARKLREYRVGSLPVCGADSRLKGMVTDRDIVIKCLAVDGDPASTTAGELAEGKPFTIGADDPVEEILRVMGEYQVRRLPVLDGKRLVGIVTLADVARSMPDQPVGELTEAISLA